MKEAWETIRHKDFFNEFTLMLSASLGAFYIGEYPEAVAVMLFYAVGEMFQDRAVDKARSHIKSLLDVRPQTATVRRDGRWQTVAPETVGVGEEIEVKTGERVPLDGVLLEPETAFNTAALSGESVPRMIGQDEEVLAGMIPTERVVRLRTVRGYTDSALSRILDMVQNAASRKAPTEQFIRRFARIYTPAVTMLALLLVVLPWLYASWHPGFIYDFQAWLYRALVFLVISCPCALVVSIPLGYFGGIGAASRRGILFKGSNYLDAITHIDAVVFDKTGTLTLASPQVADIVTFDGKDATEMLRLAACLEEHFPHSMANAVVAEAKRRDLRHDEYHSKVEYLVAHGIASHVGDERVLIGSRHFIFEDEGVVIPEGEKERFDALPAQYSHLYLAIAGRLSAVICISDPLRAEARDALAYLRDLGITNTVMLTGDSYRTAEAIAAEVGVDSFCAEVLPADKARFVAESRANGHTVIMVGDGINDSPALSEADCGIAISDGAAIAREIADVTIAADSLWELVKLRQIAMGLTRRIQSNYRFVIGFNGALLALGVAGILSPATSATLHNLSTLGVSLRSMSPLPLKALPEDAICA